MRTHFLALLIVPAWIGACSSSGSTGSPAAGGDASVGGTTATGGAGASGGAAGGGGVAGGGGAAGDAGTDAATDACAGGSCVPTCGNPTSMPAHFGCEFWAVDLDQQDGGGNDPASAPWAVAITNPGTTDANITIEINTAAVGQTPTPSVVSQVIVAKGGMQQIELPTRELDCGAQPNDYAAPGTCLSSNAFRITSDVPVAVFQLNAAADVFSNDASLLLPSHALGQSHRVLGWGAGHPIPIPYPTPIVDRSFVTIVGTQANTQVKVYPFWRIKGNAPIPATVPGSIIDVTIGPFDVLNLETDDATNNDDPTTMADLSGTLVESSAPVAVFTGTETAQVLGPSDLPKPPGWTDDTCCLDHLEEQLPPIDSLGSELIVPHSPLRGTNGFVEADVVRFVGANDVATVKTNLPAPFDSFTLQPGEVKTTWTQKDVTVSASKPVLVGQLLVSKGLTGTGDSTGDPSLLLVPAVAQYLDEYLVPTPVSWKSSWLVITAPSGTKVTLDGVAPSGCSTQPAVMLGSAWYQSIHCPVSAGVHRVQGDHPIGVLAYGYSASASYAFSGGAAH